VVHFSRPAEAYMSVGTQRGVQQGPIYVHGLVMRLCFRLRKRWASDEQCHREKCTHHKVFDNPHQSFSGGQYERGG